MNWGWDKGCGGLFNQSPVAISLHNSSEETQEGVGAFRDKEEERNYTGSLQFTKGCSSSIVSENVITGDRDGVHAKLLQNKDTFNNGYASVT